MSFPRVACLLLFAIGALRADPLPQGPGRVDCPNGAEPLTLFTYKPPTYQGGPLLVVCHGVARNAEEYRNFAITMAERFGMIVVALLFDAARFPSVRYQRGGLVGVDRKVKSPEQWIFAAIPRVVAHVRVIEALPKLTPYTFGHIAV